MRACSYARSLRVTWQDGVHSKFYIAGIGIFVVFSSCDVDLDPMTFMYELDPYSLEIYRMCKYELPMWRFSEVIVSQPDRQDRHDRNYIHVYHAASHRGWSINRNFSPRPSKLNIYPVTVCCYIDSILVLRIRML